MLSYDALYTPTETSSWLCRSKRGWNSNELGRGHRYEYAHSDKSVAVVKKWDLFEICHEQNVRKKIRKVVGYARELLCDRVSRRPEASKKTLPGFKFEILKNFLGLNLTS